MATLCVALCQKQRDVAGRSCLHTLINRRGSTDQGISESIQSCVVKVEPHAIYEISKGVWHRSYCTVLPHGERDREGRTDTERERDRQTGRHREIEREREPLMSQERARCRSETRGRKGYDSGSNSNRFEGPLTINKQANQISNEHSLNNAGDS